MFKLPFYGKKKLLLAFEYGVVISEVAKEKGVDLSAEISNRAEEIICKEFDTKGPERLAIEMIPNILAVFETN